MYAIQAFGLCTAVAGWEGFDVPSGVESVIVVVAGVKLDLGEVLETVAVAAHVAYFVDGGAVAVVAVAVGYHRKLTD